MRVLALISTADKLSGCFRVSTFDVFMRNLEDFLINRKGNNFCVRRNNFFDWTENRLDDLFFIDCRFAVARHFSFFLDRFFIDDGNKQYTEDIWVDTVEFAGGKPANKFDDNFDGDNVPDDDVPF